MTDRPGVLSINAVVIAGGNPIGVDPIRDGEITCSSCAASGGASCTARNNGHIPFPVEQVDQGNVASLENIVEKAVEAIANFEVVLAPFAHGIRNVREKCLAREYVPLRR